jgi:chromosomal replication initiation ATPase DnaA
MNEFWQSCIAHLEQEFPPQQISAWIRPLVPLAFDETGSQLRLAAPNRFKLDWVRKNFSHQIETFATTWFKRPTQALSCANCSTQLNAQRFSKHTIINTSGLLAGRQCAGCHALGVDR